MTDGERQAALEQIADEIRVCNRCRLHQQRTRSVPGEGNPETEVVFVGEGPGFNEDREGRPFVGRAGGLLVKLLASVGWRREDVFITNVVKCRPPDNRDPEPDEIAACAPFLRRQLEALDPALVVTLGRFSMGTFMPGARISTAHGTMKPVDPATGASDALTFAMYHPAAALRSTEVEQTSFRDMAGVPAALLRSREGRERRAAERDYVSEAPPERLQEPLSDEVSGQALASGSTESAPRSPEPISDVDSAVGLAVASASGDANGAVNGSRAQATDAMTASVPPVPSAPANASNPALNGTRDHATDAVNASAPAAPSASPVPSAPSAPSEPAPQLTLF